MSAKLNRGVLLRAAVLIGLVTAGWTAVPGRCRGEDLTLGAKPVPSVDVVTGMLGQPLSKLFTNFGAPSDLWVENPKAKSPSVLADYGQYAFVVQDKMVIQCNFWSEWPGLVRGVKIGSMGDEIVKILGKANEDIKNADGTEMMVWDQKNGSKLDITFDKQQKSNGMMIEKSK